MNKNYMTYPMKYMRITQNYNSTYSHSKHNTGYPKDYPIDDGGKDGGKDPIYCPCDEMVVTMVKGYGDYKITNTVWFVSTSKVVTPTFEDIAFITITHIDDKDIKNIKIGDKFKRGDIIGYEGKDGATANHIHITAGRGTCKGWEKNSQGAWVMAGNTKRPEEIFYIDRSFTDVLDSGGIDFKYLDQNYVGNPNQRDTSINQLLVKVDNLNARINPGLNSEIAGYINKGIYNYKSTIDLDGYTWYNVDNYWIAYAKEWIDLYSIEVVEEAPRLIFECDESKKYIIYLKKGAKLYLKD